MFHSLIAFSFIHSFNNCIIFRFFPSSVAETQFHNPSIIKYIISASDIRGYYNAKSASVSANIGNPTSDTPLIFSKNNSV